MIIEGDGAEFNITYSMLSGTSPQVNPEFFKDLFELRATYKQLHLILSDIEATRAMSVSVPFLALVAHNYAYYDESIDGFKKNGTEAAIASAQLAVFDDITVTKVNDKKYIITSNLSGTPRNITLTAQ
jgi:hypothetical protein